MAAAGNDTLTGTGFDNLDGDDGNDVIDCRSDLGPDRRRRTRSAGRRQFGMG